MSFMVCIGQIVLSDQIKKAKRDGACGTHGGEEKCLQDFGGKPKRKGPRRRSRRENANITFHCEIVWESVDSGGREWTGFVCLGTGTGGEQSRVPQCSVRSVPVFTNCRCSVFDVFTGGLSGD